jgi:hypothetical protein
LFGAHVLRPFENARERLRAPYARFSATAPGITRADGTLSEQYTGAVVEQVRDATFGLLRAEPVLSGTLEEYLIERAASRPRVHLSFAYSGSLFTPAMDLPLRWGQQLDV